MVEQYSDMGPTDSRILKALQGYDNKKVFSRLINRILFRRTALKNSHSSAVMTKNQDGMLDDYNQSKAELLSYLKSNHIKNLIVTGANGGACVHESISGALTNKFNVVAVTDGIADFNYEKFIYPYDGNEYASFQESCHKDCNFKVVSNIHGLDLRHPFIERQIGSGSSGTSDSPVSNPGN